MKIVLYNKESVNNYIAMRIILIVQFIIIALGAYYIYTIKEPVVDTESPEEVSVTVVPVVNENKNETVLEAELDTFTSSGTPVSGGTDVGMEYPDLGSDLQVQ